LIPFSFTVILAVAPPPSEVMTGASLTLVTVTASARVTAFVPSLARTITS
jgi:hypothetical protein